MTTAVVNLLAALSPAPSGSEGGPAPSPESAGDQPALAWIDALGDCFQPDLLGVAQSTGLPAAPAVVLTLPASLSCGVRGVPVQRAPEVKQEGEEGAEPPPLAVPVLPAPLVDTPEKLELGLAGTVLLTRGAPEVSPVQDSASGSLPAATEEVPAPRESPARQGTGGNDSDRATRAQVSSLLMPAPSATEARLSSEPPVAVLATAAPSETTVVPPEATAVLETPAQPVFPGAAILSASPEAAPAVSPGGLELVKADSPKQSAVVEMATALEPARQTDQQPDAWIVRTSGTDSVPAELRTSVAAEHGLTGPRRSPEPVAVAEWAFSARIVVPAPQGREEPVQQLAGRAAGEPEQKSTENTRTVVEAAPRETTQRVGAAAQAPAGQGRPPAPEADARSSAIEDAVTGRAQIKVGVRVPPDTTASAGPAPANRAAPRQAETEHRVSSQIPPPVSGPVRAPSAFPSSPDLPPESAPTQARTAMRAPDANRPAAAAPAHQMQFRLAGSERGPAVQVHLRDQAGELRVAVRTADGELAHSLREGLPELVQQLGRQGYEAEVWRPAAGPVSIREPGGSEATTQKTDLGSGTRDSGGSGGEQERSADGGDSRRGKESRAWSDEWQESVDGTRSR